MSKITNKMKAKELGVPFGTASYRLKKSIMFHLLQKHGENICYRCNEKILTEQELSVEHKIPWLYADNAKELFFDINNIAFSHRSCNSMERRTTLRTRGKSKYRGVYFDATGRHLKQWRVCVSVNRKPIKVGRYETEEEAARAYDEKAKELLGDKAILNF